SNSVRPAKPSKSAHLWPKAACAVFPLLLCRSKRVLQRHQCQRTAYLNRRPPLSPRQHRLKTTHFASPIATQTSPYAASLLATTCRIRNSAPGGTAHLRVLGIGAPSHFGRSRLPASELNLWRGLLV